MFRKIFLSLFVLSIPFCHLSALELNKSFDVRQLEGKRVGYYTGSFDPIHRGHQHLIESALVEEHVDYVLVYPVPGGDQWKVRTDLKIRQEMISSLYKDHPQVLVTSLTPKELQKKFASHIKSIEVIGLIGSDVAVDLTSQDEEKQGYQDAFMVGRKLRSKHANDTMGALLALKADSFIVAMRDKADLSRVIGDRPVKAFIDSSNLSSSEVREAALANMPFKHMIDDCVEGIICDQKLYQTQAR